MSEEPILTARDGDVFTIRLNRPTRLNALSIPLIQGLLAAVEEAIASGARALVLTGEGRAFCSGADLVGGHATQANVDMGAQLERGINPLLELLFGAPIPVITAINGPAAGAGVGLALAGDFALMARSSYLLLAFVNIGLVPDAGLSFLVPRLVGRQRAMEMMMLGERIPAEQAQDWGLVYKTVDDAALLDEAMALAHRLAAGPTRAYALLRRNLRQSLDCSFTESLRAERESQREAGYTADFAEGVAAFGAKRKPVFTGR
jgi:2-(1,2-epoxy-1,2-dihydrophenyl)acetyl-CoA isomerase